MLMVACLEMTSGESGFSASTSISNSSTLVARSSVSESDSSSECGVECAWCSGERTAAEAMAERSRFVTTKRVNFYIPLLSLLRSPSLPALFSLRCLARI